ncbi:MAG: PilZ domain-containing protein [Gammaproteobacteria bacterium]|nr:PilZ domain-containing protein [Gammaproteobacteria bacterium]
MASQLESRYQERRGFLRRLVNSRIKLMHGTIGSIMAKTRDISDSGVFVECYPVPKLPVGAHIKMNMLDSSNPEIAFNMKVVRTMRDGIALVFIDYEFGGQRYSMEELRKQWTRRAKKKNNRRQ